MGPYRPLTDDQGALGIHNGYTDNRMAICSIGKNGGSRLGRSCVLLN